MYSRNIAALLTHLTKDGALALDFDDEITRGSCVAHEGRPPAARVTTPAASSAAPASAAAASATTQPAKAS
jgi:H+-translocating NAD(P) transhydrogenase subunit alpha